MDRSRREIKTEQEDKLHCTNEHNNAKVAIHKMIFWMGPLKLLFCLHDPELESVQEMHEPMSCAIEHCPLTYLVIILKASHQHGLHLYNHHLIGTRNGKQLT